jgi:hypothetical protein
MRLRKIIATTLAVVLIAATAGWPQEPSRRTVIGGGDETRHIYRYDPGQTSLFTLIRVETAKCCYAAMDQSWSPIWEARAWPALHR